MRIDSILRAARKAGASDVHLVAGLPPAFRIAGEIVMAQGDALTRDQARELTCELMNTDQRDVFEREREICISVLGTPAGRVRVTGYFHAGSPEVSIRLSHTEIPTSEALGLPPIVDEMARRTSGLVLITGPNGVGKTTTLNYIVDLVNRERRCKIVTIEDPVEHVHDPKRSIIVQQEIHTDTPSFARALRHVLRQNPDVIVLGEMRDRDTVETALAAAETGHLVFSTLHTPSAAQTVERLMGIFPASESAQVHIQLADSLQAILSQRLMRRADGKGRVLALEVLVATSAVRNMIREGNYHMIDTAIQTGRSDGMRSLDAALESLYQQGLITWDALLSNARHPKQLQDRLGAARNGSAR